MSNPQPLAPGLEPFPGYTLTRHLGRGGWGEVWQAQRSEGQQVALKFLPCDSHASAAREVRALQSIRQLHHPNLIRIDQIWCWSGYVVVAMELAEGSMLDLLQIYQTEFRSGIVADHLCFYLGQIADTLDFLNARQHQVDDRRVAVRHCDVKPSNMLVMQGKVKLGDFSLAVQTTSAIGYHQRVGTVHYAAPEVFQGWLSERTDQYALAVSYVELRTGQYPFDDAPVAFNAHYARPEPNLSRLYDWEKPILHRALNAVPQDRWPSCGEMMQRLTSKLPPKMVAVK